MTDIVERLRQMAPDSIGAAAADEIERLRAAVGPAMASNRSAVAIIEALRAENDALIEWLKRQGLLAYLNMCTRPDNTLGPAWVLHKTHSIDGGSCLGWHEDSPREAVATGIADSTRKP